MKLQDTNQIIPYGPTSRIYSVYSTLVFIHFDINLSIKDKYNGRKLLMDQNTTVRRNNKYLLNPLYSNYLQSYALPRQNV